MTPFKAALGMCGLSRQEAAKFLGVSESSVDKWSRGAQRVPEGVWNEIGGLWATIKDGDLNYGGVDTSASVEALSRIDGLRK